MKYTRNAVYTRIKGAALSVAPEAFTMTAYTPTPAKFPAVFVRQVGNVQIVTGTTLVFDERPWVETYEIQVFSNKVSGAAEEAYKVMDAIAAEMANLYYIQDMLNPMDNADSSVFRLVGRWHRTTGGGEEMPTSN